MVQNDHFDLRGKWIRERISKVVSQLEKGEISFGDLVYCTNISADVIFLEKPPRKSFLNYYKARKAGEIFPPFSGKVKYKTLSGQVSTSPIACIVKISKGNFFADYEVVEGESEDRIEYLEHYGRSLGFRVERVSSSEKKKIILRFFGDSQSEVDDFVELCCQNNFIIW